MPALFHPKIVAALEIMIQPHHTPVLDVYGFLRLTAQHIKIPDILRHSAFMCILAVNETKPDRCLIYAL